MKKLILFAFLFTGFHSIAQDSTANRRTEKSTRREEKRQRISAMIRQEEEGVLAYQKQSAFGIQLRTNGYGAFYELGRTRSPRFTNLYSLEISEIKHPKEFKEQTNGVFGNSYIYGKINNFYPVKLGFGQQYILGQKGNKNGIAVMAIYKGGLSLGLLRPYYLRLAESNQERDIKYNSADSTLFLDNSGVIIGSSGLSKGWSDLSIKPGAFVKGAMRFDFGRYNEMVQAVEIGLSLEGYSSKIELMAPRTSTGDEGVKGKNLFFQGHIAFVFGRRK